MQWRHGAEAAEGKHSRKPKAAVTLTGPDPGSESESKPQKPPTSPSALYVNILRGFFPMLTGGDRTHLILYLIKYGSTLTVSWAASAGTINHCLIYRTLQRCFKLWLCSTDGRGFTCLSF